MGPKGCPEVPVTDYKPTPPNIPGERKSQELGAWLLIRHITAFFFFFFVFFFLFPCLFDQFPSPGTSCVYLVLLLLLLLCLLFPLSMSVRPVS
jgi:hypothetical protein